MYTYITIHVLFDNKICYIIYLFIIVKIIKIFEFEMLSKIKH